MKKFLAAIFCLMSLGCFDNSPSTYVQNKSRSEKPIAVKINNQDCWVSQVFLTPDNHDWSERFLYVQCESGAIVKEQIPSGKTSYPRTTGIAPVSSQNTCETPTP